MYFALFHTFNLFAYLFQIVKSNKPNMRNLNPDSSYDLNIHTQWEESVVYAMLDYTDVLTLGE